MGGDFDHSDFVDPDFEGGRRAAASPSTAAAASAVASKAGGVGGAGVRPPSRDDLNRQVTAAQQALVELKRQQEDLERERTQLEEARRRRVEYEQGRVEMVTHLTRGVGLLAEAEQTARRDAEQQARTLADLKAALEKVSALNEESWKADAYQTELTRALTTLENARMEWNAAQLKWPMLTGSGSGSGTNSGGGGASDSERSPFSGMSGRSAVELARLGLALTWPVAVAVLAAGLILAFVLSRH